MKSRIEGNMTSNLIHIQSHRQSESLIFSLEDERKIIVYLLDFI